MAYGFVPAIIASAPCASKTNTSMKGAGESLNTHAPRKTCSPSSTGTSHRRTRSEAASSAPTTSASAPSVQYRCE